MIKTEPLLAKNGIFVHDCFYHGDAVNAQPSDAKGVGTKACMDYLGGCNDGCGSRCQCPTACS